jgi:hypothetical protein
MVVRWVVWQLQMAGLLFDHYKNLGHIETEVITSFFVLRPWLPNRMG